LIFLFGCAAIIFASVYILPPFKVTQGKLFPHALWLYKKIFHTLLYNKLVFVIIARSYYSLYVYYLFKYLKPPQNTSNLIKIPQTTPKYPKNSLICNIIYTNYD